MAVSEPFQYGVIEQTKLRAGRTELYSPGSSTRSFLVRFEDKTLDDTAALFHPDIPVIRSAHPTRTGMILLSKDVRQADDVNGQAWEVTCTYGFGEPNLLPWQEPAVYSGGQQATEQIVDYDIKGKPIRNSALCQFDPGLTATRFEYVLTVSRNELDFTPATPAAYVGAVNSTPFYGAQRGFCMCVGIPWQQQYYRDERTGRLTRYYSVQYNFAFRNQFSWQPRVLDAGFMQLNDSGTLVPITIAGREPSSAVPLDGNGKPLENPETDDPTWLDFKVYPEVNFSALRL